VGVIIFVLMLIRLALRLVYPPPPLPQTVPGWQRIAAATSHWLLYLLIFGMTISGYVRVVSGGFPIEGLDALGVPPLLPESETVEEVAKAIHARVRFALFAVIFLHIAAAIYHGVILKDNVVSRMWFGKHEHRRQRH
jgi:cytochrome b561